MAAWNRGEIARDQIRQQLELDAGDLNGNAGDLTAQPQNAIAVPLFDPMDRRSRSEASPLSLVHTTHCAPLAARHSLLESHITSSPATIAVLPGSPGLESGSAWR